MKTSTQEKGKEDGKAPTKLSLGQAVIAFRLQNNYDEPPPVPPKFLSIPLGPITIPVPHPGKLEVHDIHHAVTGLPASFWGEVGISAYELRGGGGNLMVVLLCCTSLLMGLLLNPYRTRRLWQQTHQCKNLYAYPHPIRRLHYLPLREVRQRLGIPATGFKWQ